MTEKTQPKISAYIAMSIDGYIARKDGSIDWLEQGHVGDEDYGFKKFFNSIDTFKIVSSFYNDVDQQEIKKMLKYSNILVNILFGTTEYIDANDDFYLFLEKNNAENKTIKFIKFLINLINSKKYTPSRISIRSIENPLTNLLKYLLIPFKIDGLLCNNKYDINSICHAINKLYKDDVANTCVTTEICIFNPRESLKFIKFI